MSKSSFTYKTLNRFVGKAIHTYDLISDGDHILVGVSGGKDSLTLLHILSERLRFIPVHYTLTPVYLNPGFTTEYDDAIREFCRSLGHSLLVENTDYGLVAHSELNRENPCFLCSRLRRRRLFEIADDLNCTKIALGHNKEDLIETLFMNIFYSGEIATMMPNQFFFGGKYRLIRPLCLTEERYIRRYCAENEIPAYQNPCPSALASKRHEIRMMLDDLYRGNRKIKGNIFRSMCNIRKDYLLR